MKRILLLLTVFAAVTGILFARNISYIEQTSSWYYLYDTDGKKYKTISASSGVLQGYSADMFILKSGNSWYYIYDAEGKKVKTMSVSSVGEIVSVSGRTFTSINGAWLYTWDMNGKKISSRTAR